MNILVDSCSYNGQNAGDLAMLTVAVSRLRELWPSAAIAVVTNAPALVARHCGVVDTVPVRGRRLLLDERVLGPIYRRLPDRVTSRCASVERAILLRRPRVIGASLKLKAAIRGRQVDEVDAFLDAIAAAHLVVVNGAGIITDAFRDHALGILTTLELAQQQGIPTALFGQGLGPIDDHELRRRAARALGGARLVGVRESLSGPALLSALGVDPRNVVVTGDDAIELAYGARAAGQCTVERRAARRIGVNLRVAPYADLTPALLPTIREILRRAARVHDARLVPIPIAHHGGGMDVDTLRTLLDGIGDGDGGAALQTPAQVIARIGGCRVVVTGSYHGAVFALSQGIPAVALVKSRYYHAKMAGVAHEFGTGCHIVGLDENDVPRAVSDAIARAWAEADAVREPLLQSAADQVRRSRSAYARLGELLADGASCRAPV
jgi:colanic acid/amylovoran biosynthesis protein